MSKKARTKKIGRVEKLIAPFHQGVPELAQIEIEDAEHFYREIRIENALEDQNGKRVKMKKNDHVEVVIEKDLEKDSSNRDRE